MWADGQNFGWRACKQKEAMTWEKNKTIILQEGEDILQLIRETIYVGWFHCLLVGSDLPSLGRLEPGATSWRSLALHGIT
jgi:hypothetical protein